MSTWPATLPNPAYPLGNQVNLPQLRTEFDGGYVQTRRKHTRARRRFTLRWDNLTDTHKATLETFFLANQGDSFAWVHPVTATSYTVRFTADDLPFSYRANRRWSLTTELEEV